MKKFSYQIIVGSIIVIIGILLLLQTTGILQTNPLRFIPSLFIIIGIYALLKSRFRDITGPLTLITIFTIVQLWALNIITTATIFTWWPVIIIVIGIGILLSKVRGPAPPDEYTDKMDVLAIFSDTKRTIKSKTFHGGEVTSIFGDVNLDLRDSEVKKTPAHINVVSIFSDVDIWVPDNWNVRMETVPLLSDVKDHTGQKGEAEKPQLVITGFALFSDVILRD